MGNGMQTEKKKNKKGTLKKGTLKTGVALIKYGINLKINMAAMVLFTLLGIGMEWLLVFVFPSRQWVWGMWLDVGAVLLFCAAMYPSQILMSLGLSSMVEGSCYKKKLHTSVPVLISMGGNLAAVAVILLIRGLGAWRAPERASELILDMAGVGLLVLAIDILAAFIYKFFYLSMVIYVAVGVCFGTVSGFYAAVKEEIPHVLPEWHINAYGAVVFCLAMVFLGGALQYMVYVAVYKRPFSKAAFGSNTAKRLV